MDRSRTDLSETAMYILKHLPTTGVAVTAIALTAIARPALFQKTTFTLENTDTIQGKEIVEEGIRKLEIKPAAIRAMKKKLRDTGTVELDDFPLADGTSLDLDLRESNPIAPGAKLTFQSSADPATARTEPLFMPEDMLILTGQVRGEDGSFAMLALSEKASFGLIQNSKGTSVISSGKPGAGFDPVIYDPKTALGGILDFNDFMCGVEAGDAALQARPPAHRHGDGHVHQGGLAGAGTCQVIKLALEYDFEFWTNSLNADGWAGLFYTIALVASVDEIYRRDTGIGIQLSNLRVWEEADDPWTGADVFEQLDELKAWFEDNGDDVDRDAVMLCSSRALGGGLAFIGGLCNDFGYGVSGSMSGFFTYPLTDFDANNWDIDVVTHELGHILGTIHTHEFCPPLDQCASATFFGTCQAQQVCGQGTIMSYCHACPGGMTNKTLRFHPSVSQMIVDYVSDSACIAEQSSSVSPQNDSADTLMNTRVVIDALMNDTATCTLAEIAAFDTTSSAGGTIKLSTGTGPYGRDELSYRPPTGFTGNDTFNYVASDGWISFVSAQVTVDVDAQEDMTDLLVIDPAGNIVQRFDWQTGAFLGTLVPPSEGGMDFAYSACSGPDDEVIVASFKNDYALRYDSMSGVSTGVLAGGNVIDTTNDVAYDEENVYVSGRDAQQVAVFDENGDLVATYQAGDHVNDILLEATRDRVLVARGSGGFGGSVQFWSTETHQMIDEFQTPEVMHTSAVSRLPEGDIIVADSFLKQIARYDAQTHAFEGWFVSVAAATANNLGAPQRIERGPDDRMYITSTTGLHRYDANGAFNATLEASGAGLLYAPVGLHFRLGERIDGDINGDGVVDGVDLAAVLGDWGGSGAADLNRDGVVNGTDLAILLGNWS